MVDGISLESLDFKKWTIGPFTSAKTVCTINNNNWMRWKQSIGM